MNKYMEKISITNKNLYDLKIKNKIIKKNGSAQSYGKKHTQISLIRIKTHPNFFFFFFCNHDHPKSLKGDRQFSSSKKKKKCCNNLYILG